MIAGPDDIELCDYSSNLTSTHFDRATGGFLFKSIDRETLGSQILVFEVIG